MPEAMLPAVVLILCSERGRSERAGRAGEHAVVDGGVDACGRRSLSVAGAVVISGGITAGIIAVRSRALPTRCRGA
jgi:hypothetical protein